MAKRRGKAKPKPAKKKRSAKSAKSAKSAALPPLPPAGLLTRRQLAVAMKVVMMTITKWEREGMPIALRGGKGRPSFYREVDVRAWKQQRDDAAVKPGAVDLVKERARKERAQAVLAEQAYEIRRRDLLPREEVEKTWSSEVAAVRTKLLSWSATLSDQVYRVSALEGLAGIERVIDDAVRDVLVQLADPKRAPIGGEAAPAA
jgi:phage terminase Nu1 subunit (DNA packaging protein)